MTFDFYQLDSMTDVDEVMEILEDEYIPQLVEQFVVSPEGQAYIKSDPELEEDYVGNWVVQLLFYGYAYLEVTLPQMTAKDVKEVVTGLFPRKISLMDPDEADTAIPELNAFWQFLKRQYKHRHATKILNLLKKIQPQFKSLMNDPTNFGITKSFLMSGMQAGFDMTTEEGMRAYQEQYNRQLSETGAPPPGFPAFLGSQNANAMSLPISGDVPPEFVALMSQRMGLGPISGLEHLPSNPEDLMQLLVKRLVESGMVSLEGEEESPLTFQQGLQAETLRRSENAIAPLAAEAITLLQQQSITDTEPGTILKDVQTLLDFIGEEGIPVSGTLNHLPMKSLAALNQQLSHPIQIDLKRPQQKSYPNINGLYLLLRATGIGQVIGKGKQQYLVLERDRLESWKCLNPPEQYFTLLEAWMIRSHPEMLGEERDPLGEGIRSLRSWTEIPDKGRTFRDYREQEHLSYWPGLHNLVLMQMFGWLQIESQKPAAGKGWHIKKIRRLPIGDAIASCIFQAYQAHDFIWESTTQPELPFGELQPYFQPYFPEWKTNLKVPIHEFREGTYIFKVSVGKAWRRLAIGSDRTLSHLSALILKSVDFGADHLDMFVYKSPTGRTVEIHHSYNQMREGPTKDEVKIGDLPLTPGMVMTYIFDFGDWWKFQVLLEEIQPGKPQKNSAKILERHGKSPEQYPDWDEEDEE